MKQCPYCSKGFKTWKGVRGHLVSCVKNTGEYFVHQEKGPIHYTKILEYQGIIPLKDALRSLRKRGFDIPKIRRAWTPEECIQAIHDFCVENGRIPQTRDFENSEGKYPSIKTIVRYFGSWNSGIEATGYTPIIQKDWSPERCIQAIHDFWEENGYIPQSRDFKNSGGKYPSSFTVSNLFGSWNKAIKAAGYTPIIQKDWSPERCIQAIQMFYTENDRIPVSRDFTKSDGKYPSNGTVSNLFGTWNKGIEAAGFISASCSIYGVLTIGKDGHQYLSKMEAYFCDKYLFEQYDYEIEPHYPEPNSIWRYDWYLSALDLYIELDGGIRPWRMREKIAFNEELGRKCLVVNIENINKINLADYA